MGRWLTWLRRGRSYLFDRFGIRVEIQKKRPQWPGQRDRYSYQKRYLEFDIRPGQRVLDIGSGGDPFPFATVLTDKCLKKSPTRTESLVTNGKPLVLADVHNAPFADKSFAYVYCAHVLELVEDPVVACQEIMRIGQRGFIEAPAAAKDLLFSWAKGLQKWHLVAIGQNICFFEYSPRELEGIRSTVWRELIMSQRSNPLQEVFYNNQDVFNVMFTWEDRFGVFVFRLDGSIQTLNTAISLSRQEP